MAAHDELQAVVDHLAGRLRRSVAIDNSQMHLIVHSRHYGPVDESRQNSILQRVADGPAVDHVRSFGIERATRAVRVGPSAELGQLARVCIPLVHQGFRLGYLWLIDADESLTPFEIQVASDAAADAASTLYMVLVGHELERGRARELLRDLLGDAPELRRLSATQLVAEGHLAPGAVVAVVVRGVPLHIEDARVLLDATLAESARRLHAGRGLHLVRPDHGVLLVTAPLGQGQDMSLRKLGERLRADVVRRLGRLVTPDLRVGIGGWVESLAEAASSYEQAGLAERVSGTASDGQGIAVWDDLGVYRTLARLPIDLLEEAIDPALATLLEVDSDGIYATTLETFLDLAGHPLRVAAALQIHRTTVYYRLSRIAAITGCDLEDGNVRLSLHMSLKIARLNGRLT